MAKGPLCDGVDTSLRAKTGHDRLIGIVTMHQQGPVEGLSHGQEWYRHLQKDDQLGIVILFWREWVVLAQGSGRQH